MPKNWGWLISWFSNVPKMCLNMPKPENRAFWAVFWLFFGWFLGWFLPLGQPQAPPRLAPSLGRAQVKRYPPKATKLQA